LACAHASLLSIYITVENTMQNVIFLALAIAAEIVATSSLKTSDGFTRLWPSLLTVAAYGVAFYLLAQTLKRMEIGVVYAIWSGAGTALMALVGYWFFQESMSAVKAVSITLIVLGVIGLNLGDLVPGGRM
jgi:small multidrug resistance pump